MPRAHNAKAHTKPNGPAKDEHLIFVKNVPAYLATEAVPELFARYRPDRIKNVYPKSDITTVVVGFATQEKASQAQQETDGMRLENVVLRVEMYSKHRSVRYLQEARTKSQPTSAAEEDYEELDECEEVIPAEPEYVLPFARKPQEGSGPSTWAQVAGTDRKTDMIPPPLPGVAPLTEFPTPSEQRASPEPEPPIKVAVPRIDTARNTDNATPLSARLTTFCLTHLMHRLPKLLATMGTSKIPRRQASKRLLQSRTSLFVTASLRLGNQ
jgi:hypothetical protein